MEDVAAKEKKDAADTEKDVTRMRQDAGAIEAVVAPAKAVVLTDLATGKTADGFESMGRRRRRRRKNKSSAQGSPALAVSACVTLAAAVLA